MFAAEFIPSFHDYTGAIAQVCYALVYNMLHVLLHHSTHSSFAQTISASNISLSCGLLRAHLQEAIITLIVYMRTSAIE
jgi:hypothetical protein